MFKGLIDTQSLKHSDFLEKLNVFGTYEEEWPGEEVPVLKMARFTVEDDAADEFVKTLSKNELEEGWFTLLWDARWVFVIFENRVFKLENTTPWDPDEWHFILEYGAKHDIDAKYFRNIRRAMDHWEG